MCRWNEPKCNLLDVHAILFHNEGDGSGSDRLSLLKSCFDMQGVTRDVFDLI